MYRNSARPGLLSTLRFRVLLVGILLGLTFIHWAAHRDAGTPRQKPLSRGHHVSPQGTAVAGNSRALPALRDRFEQSEPIPPLSQEESWGTDPSQWAVPATPKSQAPVYTAEELLGKLSAWGQRDAEPISSREASKITRTLRQLAARGEMSVLAIREFLGSGKDVDFAALRASDQIGYQSLRLALFDLVRRVGASDAEIDTGKIFLEALRTTGSPLEVATLAGYLEAQAPGYYRQEILAAARNLLATASENGVNGHDAGPLFRVFQNYGNAETLAQLESVNPLWWGRYAAVALANLPEGKGIPSLIKTLQASSSPATNPHAHFALNLLAQAANYPEAQTPIIEAIRANAIPDMAWPEFAAMVAGLNQIQIEKPEAGTAGVSQQSISFAEGGTQVVYEIQNSVAGLSAEQVMRRAEFIARLIGETSNPVAIQALQRMQAALLGGINPVQ